MSDAPTKPTADVIAAMVRPPESVVAGNEIVILAVKPSLWHPIFESTPVLATVGVLLLTLSMLNPTWLNISFTWSIKILLAIGFARLGVAIVRWIPTWYMLTNRRIITVTGIRSPQIYSCLLLDIRNTYVNKTMAERMVGIGSISFATDNPQQFPMPWPNLARPMEVHLEIRKAIENAIDLHHL